MDRSYIKVGDLNSGQSPVSQKSRNFSGLFRVPQFPLYLRNAEVVSHQTSQSSSFSYIENTLKDQLFKTSGLQFDNWLFRPQEFSALSRNRPQILTQSDEKAKFYPHVFSRA